MQKIRKKKPGYTKLSVEIKTSLLNRFKTRIDKPAAKKIRILIQQFIKRHDKKKKTLDNHEHNEKKDAET